MSIVYSTVISKAIRSAFHHYQSVKESDSTNRVAINAAYCQFANACEKENKNPATVYAELLDEE